jgi:hypothetical protein
MLPSKCVHKDGGQDFIYVHRPGDYGVKRIVSVANRLANETEIVRGLSADEKVALETGGTTK